MKNKPKNKEEIKQIKDSEKKFQSYIEKRNELNDEARLLREERDMIHKSKKEQKEEIDKLRKERDELVEKMREHKKIRNKLQKEAKKLIEAKRKKKGEVFRNLPMRVEELKADAQMLEYKQETVPLNPRDENKLIEKIREKKQEYKKLKKQMEKQKEIQIDISDKDNAIDELFKKADEEHELVDKYYNESQKKHERYIKLVKEMSVSIAEANKKHEKYIKIKKEADTAHQKAYEMKSKIMAIKGERRKRYKEAKRAIKDQNIKARRAVLDKKKLEEHADESVEALKKGKKIKLK